MSDLETVDDMVESSKEVIREALDKYDNPAILWTGGKDSTLVVWLAKQVAEEEGRELSDLFDVVFIEHGQHFDEVEEFTDAVSDAWGFDVVRARNDDFLEKVDDPFDEVDVDDLSQRNREEVERLEYRDGTVPYDMDTEVCSHLLKTVALNDVIEEEGYDAVLSGIRWDEQEARSDEEYFSPRQNPDHDRVHPILHFTEQDIWDTSLEKKVPVNPLYEQGYRSIGSEPSTEKTTDIPAWEQNLDDTVEREGRSQDKEGIMEHLRDLGYM